MANSSHRTPLGSLRTLIHSSSKPLRVAHTTLKVRPCLFLEPPEVSVWLSQFVLLEMVAILPSQLRLSSHIQSLLEQFILPRRRLERLVENVFLSNVISEMRKVSKMLSLRLSLSLVASTFVLIMHQQSTKLLWKRHRLNNSIYQWISTPEVLSL